MKTVPRLLGSFRLILVLGVVAFSLNAASTILAADLGGPAGSFASSLRPLYAAGPKKVLAFSDDFSEQSKDSLRRSVTLAGSSTQSLPARYHSLLISKELANYLQGTGLILHSPQAVEVFEYRTDGVLRDKWGRDDFIFNLSSRRASWSGVGLSYLPQAVIINRYPAQGQVPNGWRNGDWIIGLQASLSFK